MATQQGMRGVRSASRQRGWALLLTAALIALGVLGVVLSMASSTSTASANERSTVDARALATAKEALIGYAVSQTNQPGALPCPDTDNDGTADSPCGGVGVTAIGRLPWRTLGLPDLRDAAGECLWYAVSSNFKNSGVSGPAVINSDSWGTLTINDGVGTPLPSPPNPAVAIIFAPGKALAGQDRTPPVGPATICGGNSVVANYLEGSNAVVGTTYVSSTATDTRNDRLLPVSTADVMTPVERRVARELRAVLQSYKTAVGVYPWADISTGYSDYGLNRGRVPGYDTSGATTPPYALPEDWGFGGSLPLPAWFTNNGWRRIIYYAAGRSFLGSGCTSCEAGQTTLSVDGVWGKEVVILTPGPAGAGRPVTPYPWTDWTPYLEDSENRDDANDRYVTPSSQAYARDRIHTIP